MSIQGAIPLKSNSTSGGQGRLDLIPNDLPTKFNVGGVISVNQEFERVVTLSFDEWQAKDVELLKVDCADFKGDPIATWSLSHYSGSSKVYGPVGVVDHGNRE